MKQIYLFFVGTLLCLQCAAQTTYRYSFNGGLHELTSNGPVLSSSCSGNYNWESLPTDADVSKTVYRFEKGCELIFDDKEKKFLTAGTYTIEMYFKLDSIQGYRKLIDFDSLKKDEGLYNIGGKLTLYNTFFSTDSFLAPDKYIYIVVTRDDVTKDMYVYANNIVVGMMNDNTDAFKYSTAKTLIFFKDDQATNKEHGAGTVAAINISDFVMDSVKVKSNYANLSSRVGIDEVGKQSKITVYPNPASDVVHIDMQTQAEGVISDITGKALLNVSLTKGVNDIALDNMRGGVYLLTLYMGNSERVYKIVKQ